MLSELMALEVEYRKSRELYVHMLTTRTHPGFTRRAIGATFEGQTKEEDGQVWADVEVEGIGSDVSYSPSVMDVYAWR